MILNGIIAVCLAVLAGWGREWFPAMYGLGFLVSFAVFALGKLALRGHTLLRTIGGVSALGALSLSMLIKGGFWTFLWSFLSLNLGLILLAVAVLLIVTGAVDLSKPQAEHDDKVYRRIMDLYIAFLIDLVGVRVHGRGLENIPKEGRFLLVCNHLYVADPGILLNAFPKSQLAFITKQENQKIPVINKFMYKILCQNLDREDDRQALKVILKCIQLLKDDEVSVAVFPEGYTSRDGKLHHFRNGVFKIAQKAKVPIVVCTIQNTRAVFHNLKRLKPTDVALHLVDVIPAQELEGKTTVEIGDRVWELMISDLGESFRPIETEA